MYKTFLLHGWLTLILCLSSALAASDIPHETYHGHLVLKLSDSKLGDYNRAIEIIYNPTDIMTFDLKPESPKKKVKLENQTAQKALLLDGVYAIFVVEKTEARQFSASLRIEADFINEDSELDKDTLFNATETFILHELQLNGLTTIKNEYQFSSGDTSDVHVALRVFRKDESIDTSVADKE